MYWKPYVVVRIVPLHFNHAEVVRSVFSVVKCFSGIPGYSNLKQCNAFESRRQVEMTEHVCWELPMDCKDRRC